LIFQYWSSLGCLAGNILFNQNVLQVQKMQDFMSRDTASMPVAWGTARRAARAVSS